MFESKWKLRAMVAELEIANINLNRRLAEWEDQWKERNPDALRNQVEYLVRTIRDIDEQIYKMSQCTDWSSMRPNFQVLEEGMISRKKVESDRIRDILRPELIKTYGLKQIGNK
jgi:hypothetical protein